MAYKKYNKGFLMEAYALDKTTGASIDFSSKLARLAIQRNFVKNTFEQVVVTLDKITEEEMRMLRDNDFSLAVKIYEFTPSVISVDASETSEITPEAVVCDFIMRVYEKPFISINKKVEMDGDSEIGDYEKAAPFYTFEFVGVPEEQIGHNAKAINNVFRNALLVDAVVNVACKELTTEKLRLIEPKNTKVYPNIIIPPNNFIPALRNLDNVYHLYDSAANIYFDRTGLYIYPIGYDGLSSNTIECLVRSSETTSTEDNINIEKDEDTENLRVTLYKPPTFQSTEKILSHIPGASSAYYSYDEDFSLKINEANNDSSYEKERYIWNDDGSYFSETSFSRMYEFSKSTVIALSGVNPYLINPLTVLRITSQDYPAVNGDYTIGEASVVFGSQNQKYYSSTVMVTAMKR